MLHTAQRKGSVRSVDGSAQGWFSEYWRGNVTWLPSHFNLVQSSYCVSMLEQSPGVLPFTRAQKLAARADSGSAEARASSLLREGAVAVLHFHFAPKPWNLLRSNVDCGLSWCGRRWDAVQTALPPFVAAWTRAFRNGTHPLVHAV